MARRGFVPDHLKLVPDPDPGVLLRNMLTDGGDEFFGREDLEPFKRFRQTNGRDWGSMRIFRPTVPESSEPERG